MDGFKTFLDLCGDITLTSVAEIIVVCIFLFGIYKRLKEYLISKHVSEQLRLDQLNEAVTATRELPSYRQKSLEIQEEFAKEITDMKSAYNDICQRLLELEETNKKREQNRLRGLLIQQYRFYTDKENNPDQSWTVMEEEAFWALFRDYEEVDGDGYMHTVVAPAMQLLQVVDNVIV